MKIEIDVIAPETISQSLVEVDDLWAPDQLKPMLLKHFGFYDNADDWYLQS